MRIINEKPFNSRAVMVLLRTGTHDRIDAGIASFVEVAGHLWLRLEQSVNVRRYGVDELEGLFSLQADPKASGALDRGGVRMAPMPVLQVIECNDEKWIPYLQGRYK